MAETDPGAELSEIDAEVERAYALRVSNPHDAQALASSARERAERAGYTRGIARALVTLGAAHCRRMELDQAAAHLESALELFKTHPDRIGRARALSWLGSVANRREDYAGCMRIWPEALAQFHAAGDRQGEAEVLHKIGVLQMLLGDFVAALDNLAESRKIKEEFGDQHGIALTFNDTAVAFAELGDLESARQSFEEALALNRRLGSVEEVSTLANLGLCCHELGEHQQALAHLEECLSLCRPLGDALTEATALCTVGKVYQAMGEPQQALSYFTASEELAQKTGALRPEIFANIGAARVLAGRGETDHAVERLTRALSAAQELGLQRFVADAHEVLAEAYEAAGNLEAALRHHKAFHEVREKVQQAGAALRARHRVELAQLRHVQQETELQVLKAQLQPHFLLNALHSLSTLIEINPSGATRAVAQLGDLLRLALVQSSNQRATLEAEIEFVRAYLKLEQARYRDTFTYTITVEPGLESIQVPHLLLQPLAENSIRHGLAGAEGEARIEIRAERTSADRLRLTVRDTGVGLPPGWSWEATGVGLRNTRLRLQRLHGPEHEFRVEPDPAGGTRVEIVLPISRESRAAG